MLYANDGLKLMESIEASLLRLAGIRSDEPDSEAKRQILAYHMKAVVEYQSLLASLHGLSARLENYNDLSQI